MTMTRQHFKLIADVLNDARSREGLDQMTVRNIAWKFELALRATNARFNPSRFLRACGVED